MRPPDTPAGTVTLADLESDPHPVLARLRAAAPACWVPVLGTWLVGFSRRVFGVPAQGVDGLDEFLDRVASLRLPWRGYAEVFGLAVLNWIADCGALACAIKAAGQPVPWHSLLLVYGAGAAVGSTGITPGGFALVELALTAALTAAGLHRSAALAAVLAYRLVNFWMILIGGWMLMALLAHRRIGPGAESPGSPGNGG